MRAIGDWPLVRLYKSHISLNYAAKERRAGVGNAVMATSPARET